jgi:uncharacterized protein (DUF488 family)
MAREQTWVTGIGYEGLALDEFVSELASLRIDILVDVRLNAISRKRGFSKTALSLALTEAGITYLHRPVLGNEKSNRDGYGETRTPTAHAAREVFRQSMKRDEPAAALTEIAALASANRVAIFCFEKSQTHCHREQVIHAVLLKLAEPARV